MSITRRGFGLAAFGGLILPSIPALAKAPLAGAQAPGLYRQKVGALELTVLSDGWLPLETKLFAGDAMKKEVLLAEAFLPKDATKTSVNEWLVNTGDRLVLIDAGTSNVFAPTLGRMPKNLAAAGVEPSQIDEIIITHLHPDHVAGLLTTDKAIAYPNATVHIGETEYAFWTNEEIYAKVPADVKPFFDIARASTKPYKDAGKIVFFKEGKEILPGILSFEAPGHTMGHTMVCLSSGGAELMIVTDIVHNAALQFANPDWSMAFDTDQAMAAASRKKALDLVSTDHVQIAGAHLPFPGLGHVAKAGTGFTYLPTPWTADL